MKNICNIAFCLRLSLHEQEKSTEYIFPQIFEKKNFPLLRLLGISSDSWQMVYKNELTPLDWTLPTPPWLDSSKIFFFKKACVCVCFPSWWHRSAFLSVLSYALRFEDPRVSLPFFSNAYFWDKLLFWVLHLLYAFVIDGEFFQVYNEIQSQGSSAGHVSFFIGYTYPFSKWLLLSLHGQHGMGLIGRLESSNSSNATGSL